LRTITEKGIKRDDLVKAFHVKHLNVRDVVIGEPTLEDVFITLAKG
jgi:hypothetical protein